MKRKIIVVIVITIIIVPNLPIIGTWTMGKIDANHFRYANNDASFTSIQRFDFKTGWISEWTVWGFIEDQRPIMRNMEVFRLYRINPLCFWRWRYYLTVSRKFKYKSWKKIEPNRTPFIQNNVWQQF